MRSKIIILVVALALGGLAAVMAARYLSGARASLEDENQSVKVLVAAEDVPRGLSSEELLSRKILVMQDVPARFVSADAVSSARTLEGQVLATPLSKGEQVTRARFQVPSQAGLAYSVPKDVVALTVPVDENRGVAGLVKPGDHVTVFVTLKAQQGEPTTKMLLPGARVLAVGMALQAEAVGQPSQDGAQRSAFGSKQTGQEQKAASTVTLAVAAKDAERLVFGMENGSIWLGLLPATVSGANQTKGQTLQTVLR